MEDKDTIAFLSNYITELKKEHLDAKGKEILRATEEILRREVKLQCELKELKSKHDNIKTMCGSKPQFFSHTPKNEDDKLTIEDLNKNKDLNRVLDLATNLILRDRK